MSVESLELVETQHHEFTINYNFDRIEGQRRQPLKALFAFDSRIKEETKPGEDAFETTFTVGDERWCARLRYTRSGLLPPSGGCTSYGTRFDLEEIREPRVDIWRHKGEDPGQDYSENLKQNIHAHIRPRWQNLRAEKDDGSEVSLSHPLEEGLSIRMNGSNVAFDRYLDLFRAAVDALGIHRDYFSEPHESSNVQDAAKYVRVHTHASGPVHSRTGPLAKMGHLLEDDRSGYRKTVQNDDDKYGNKKPGWYHTTTLGPDRIQALFPRHEFPKESKHYYHEEYQNYSIRQALRHPKVEVAYQVSRWDGKVGHDEIDQLEREIDELLYALLQDAGLDLRAGGKTYVEDAYFAAENVERDDLTIPNLNLTEIKQEQRDVVIDTVCRQGGLSESEFGVLQTLVTDGGEVSPQDIADDQSLHLDTVYRALEKLGDLVEREYGSVSIRSSYVADLVTDAVVSARESVERVVDTAVEAVQAADRGLDDRTTAFHAWATKYGLNYDKEDGDVTVRLGEIEADSESEARNKITRILREGHKLWEKMNRDPDEFMRGTWKAKLRYKEQSLKSIDPFEKTERDNGTIGLTVPRD